MVAGQCRAVVGVLDQRLSLRRGERLLVCRQQQARAEAVFPENIADAADKTAADLKAAGVISFTAPEKKVLPNTFGGLQNWFFTGPSGEQIELLQML